VWLFDPRACVWRFPSLHDACSAMALHQRSRCSSPPRVLDLSWTPSYASTSITTTNARSSRIPAASASIPTPASSGALDLIGRRHHRFVTAGSTLFPALPYSIEPSDMFDDEVNLESFLSMAGFCVSPLSAPLRFFFFFLLAPSQRLPRASVDPYTPGLLHT
jgi:hypothetical protein